MTINVVKMSYSAPELMAYGSVRNLTGGSSGGNPDFASMRMCTFPRPFNTVTNMCA